MKFKSKVLKNMFAAFVALSLVFEPFSAFAADNGVEMYRLYNPNSGEHFYTKNAAEKNNLVKLGWKYEGIGWTAPNTSSTPVYRLYNPNAGDHHYTMDANEKNALVKVGWNYEGIGWYSDDAKRVPLYRQYNPNAKAGSHNYTTNKAENDHLVKVGWKAEGIGWYGVGNVQSSTPAPSTPSTITITNLAFDAVPIEHKGYFIGKGTDGLLHIYDGNGNEIAADVPKDRALKGIKTTENGNVDIIWFSYQEKWVEEFDYLVGLTNIENQQPQLGGAFPCVASYDEETKKVLVGDTSSDPSQIIWKEEPIDESNVLSIYSKKNAEILYENHKNGNYGTRFDTFYIWNPYTNKVTGPYTENGAISPGNRGLMDASYYVINNSFITKNFSFYTERQEDGSWKAVNKTAYSNQSYDQMIPVEQDALLGWKNGVAYLILESNMNQPIELGTNIRFSTKIAQGSNKYLVQTNDGQWQIRQK